jgi:tetratricopeptide (TPR) repeat protein
MDNLNEASHQFIKALQLDPDYVEASHNLAITCDQLNLVDEALFYYQKTLKTAPHIPGLKCHYIRLLQNICAWDELDKNLHLLNRNTDSELQQSPPEESPFLNITYNDNPLYNLQIAMNWSKEMLNEAKTEMDKHSA